MKRTKTVATLLFILALAGAFIALPYRENSFAGGLLFAACGSALVGALADWFAVSALFRHPLGLKFIPHTAIIPNNRDRIIEGIIAMVEKDWLSLDFIRAKIFDYPLIDGLALALETENGRKELDRLAQSVAVHTLQGLMPEKAARFLQLLVKDNLKEIKISPSLLGQLEESVKTLYTEDIIEILLNLAVGVTRGSEFEAAVKSTLKSAVSDYSKQGNFFRRLGKGLGESLDILNYEEAGEMLAHHINHFLVEMKEPDNQYHNNIKAQLQKLKIADSDETAQMLSGMLKNMVDSEAGYIAVTEVIAHLKAQFLIGCGQDMPMIRNLTNMIVEQISIIRRDEERKANIEFRIKTELSNLLERYHGVIGQIVREKLQSLNDSGLVKSLEDKVGDDLQWIRINGTVIGALVGALQYLILR